jgi:hypothetical protein
MLRNLFDKGWQRPAAPGSAQCGHVQSRLPSYLDHALDAAERRLVEGHLEECSACRADLAAYERAESALGSAVSTIPSPGDMRAEFYARLEQSRRTSPPVRWALAIPAAACAGLLFLALRGTIPDHGQAALPPVHESRPVAAHGSIQPHGQARPDGALAKKSDSGTDLKLARLSPADEKVAGSGRYAVTSGNNVRAKSLRSRLSRTTIVAKQGPLDVRRRIVVPHTDAVVGIASARARSLATAPQYEAEVTDSLAARDNRDADSTMGDKRGTEHYGRTVLASLTAETELHVSDENRDFMASTHIGPEARRNDSRPSVQVDDDNETAQETVELPALP